VEPLNKLKFETKKERDLIQKYAQQLVNLKQALSRAIINKQIDIENVEEFKFEDFQQFCDE
jgi:hypothetical protein